jgi:hypothetical protein
MNHGRVVAAVLLAGVMAAATASADDAANPVHVVRTIPGMSGPNPESAGSTSADMMGGVTDKYLVGFVNGGMFVLSKKDGREVRPPQTQLEFWTTAFKNAGRTLEGNPYDPRIFYDPLTRRWFASANSHDAVPSAANGSRMSARILFAVSQDDDPTHPWKAVHHATPVAIDNAKLGLDRNGVYSTSVTGGGKETESRVPVIAFPKADFLWKGEGAPSVAHVNEFMVNGGSRMSDRKYSGIEGMVPAFDLDPAKKADAPEVFVNRYRTEVDGETMVQVRTVTWTSPTTARLGDAVTIGLGTHYAVQPPTTGVQPPLPGGLLSPGIRAGEARIVNAVVRNGSLWTIAAADVGKRTAAFWVQIDLGTMKLVQHGTVADPDADILFPSINVDAKGNVGIGMSRTSATEHLSIYVTGRLATDPPNTVRPLVRAVQGHYVHLRKDTDLKKPGQTVSWSDYSTVVVDPSDPTLFWTYQEATTNETMPPETNGDRFGTHWVAWRVGGKTGK